MHDVVFALRAIRKLPGFAAVVCISVALGIAANTTVFSMVNATLLGALPVHDPGGLYTILRIPSDADQRSEVMAIAIPKSCRSRFRADGDHHSDGKPITFRRSSEWRSASSESFS